MHPVNDIIGTKSNLLKNKTIVLGITGSIAAVETIKLSRELIRHGAKIIPVMSKSATKIIHPDAIWFATGKKPIIELSGDTEHVSLLGRVKKPADLFLICPATANTISKIAHGIDDNAITTFATTAIGSKIPMIIVPAMHLSMYDHKIIKENISKLKKNNIIFIKPNILKNKAKLPDQETIIAKVIRALSKNDYEDKKVLIIGGPTAEYIDDIRIIKNISSGKTAKNLAINAYYRGAYVELWYGSGTEKIPNYIKKTDFFTSNDIKELIQKTKMKNFDYIFLCAAISDYIPEKQKGKIKSKQKNLKIILNPNEKIIKKIRSSALKSKLIAFKAEEDDKDILEKSKKLLKENKLEFVIGNNIKGFKNDNNEIFIISDKKVISKKGKKQELTNYILDKVKT